MAMKGVLPSQIRACSPGEQAFLFSAWRYEMEHTDEATAPKELG
jgi:hypothetical protein